MRALESNTHRACAHIVLYKACKLVHCIAAHFLSKVCRFLHPKEKPNQRLGGERSKASKKGDPRERKMCVGIWAGNLLHPVIPPP